MNRKRRFRLGLALGSGSARGWAHIGVIRVLEDAGIVPDVVCGTSIGSLVAAAHAADVLDPLEQWTRSLTWQSVVRFLDFSVGGGLIKGTRLVEFISGRFKDRDIRQLSRTFGAVATDLESGREMWLIDGSVIAAVRASISLPGLFTPASVDGRLLVDGGLVNPVPVSLCRALGADMVIAVDLSADLVGRQWKQKASSDRADPGVNQPMSVFGRLQAGIASALSAGDARKTPSMLDVMTAGINIMQVRITRSRLAGEPADVLITPRLADLALLDFHRANEAIAEGRRAAQLALPQITSLLDDITKA